MILRQGVDSTMSNISDRKDEHIDACLAAAVKGAESTAADNRQGNQQNKRSKERH